MNFIGDIRDAAVEIKPLGEFEASVLDLALKLLNPEERDSLTSRGLVAHAVIVSATSIPTIDGTTLDVWDKFNAMYATPEFITEAAQVGILLAMGYTPKFETGGNDA